jgi:hypothetical protein
VIPYRSQVQHEDVEETELGVLLLLLRELSEGTFDETSESDSSPLLSESLICWFANLSASISTVGFWNCSSAICRVSFGFTGFGLCI